MDGLIKMLQDNWTALAGLFALVIIILFIWRWRAKVKAKWTDVAEKIRFKVEQQTSHSGYKVMNSLLLHDERDGMDFYLYAVESEPAKPYNGTGVTILEIDIKNKSLVMMLNGVLNKEIADVRDNVYFGEDESSEKMQDASLGDGDFNRHFLIETNKLLDARRMIDNQTQQLLKEHIVTGFVTEDRYLTARLKEGHFVIKKSPILSTDDEIMKLINLGFTMARKVKVEEVKKQPEDKDEDGKSKKKKKKSKKSDD